MRFIHTPHISEILRFIAHIWGMFLSLRCERPLGLAGVLHRSQAHQAKKEPIKR